MVCLWEEVTDIQVIRQQSSLLFLVASYIFALCLFRFQCQHLSQCEVKGGLCIKEVSSLLARIPLNRVCVCWETSEVPVFEEIVF